MARRINISTKINLFLLFVVFLPLLAMLIVVYVQVKQNTDALVEQNLGTLAAEAGVDVDRLIDNALKDVLLCADAPVLRSGGANSLAAKLAELKRIKKTAARLDDLVLIDQGGTVLGSVSYGTDRETWLSAWFDWRDSKGFNLARRGTAAVVTERARRAPFWLVVALAVPIYDYHGQVQAVLGARLRMAEVWRLLERIDVGETGALYVIDAQGNAVYHPSAAQRLRPLEPAELREALVGSETHGMFEYAPVKGHRLICSYRHLAGYDLFKGIGWTLAITREVDEMSDLARRMQAQVLAFSTGCFIFLLVLGGLLSRHIVKPINTLVRATEGIAAGNLNVRTSVRSHDELGELARSFDKMTLDLQRAILSRDEEIAERRRAEQLLQKARDELEHRVHARTAELAVANDNLKRELTERERAERELKNLTAELERSNKELQEFAYVASHDLQEPLRMVSSYTTLLSRRYKGKLDESADDFIGFAVDGATRMQKLINGLLQYSRVGTKGKQFEPTDVNDIFAQSVNNLTFAIEENEAQVTRDELPVVMADDVQLVQLFQNLIGNAIKFHGETLPQVHVGVRQEGETWIFSVKDNGIGIEQEYRERIFVIFQRLHGRQEYAGTGIGLAVCKRIVERHGGHIWVESESGAGSTFLFTIPIRAIPKKEEPST